MSGSDYKGTGVVEDTRELTQRGSEIGDSNVELLQNRVDENTPALKWTCPRKYNVINYSAARHVTRFVPRTMQEYTYTGSATVSLNNRIQPVAGETALEDQPHPVVEAVNVTQGTVVDITDVNYATNEVTFDDTPTSTDDVLKFFPILAEGMMQYRVFNRFEHDVAPVNKWSFPLASFHDFKQNKLDNRIYLVGAFSIETDEEVALMVDSPHQIVWEDADYSDDAGANLGAYVSTIEQEVDISIRRNR